ncbi:hypothetical protein AB0395_16505 [Streptosporangium sp. NPDC051023]|uniref:hypothetical protein n=1 Tax=Streptosporangium sp. NPDC051023 TaxID=3155410 RepID=UPI00344EC5C0
MSRRVLTLLSSAVLAAAAVLAASSPAQAAVVEYGESPISTGYYCASKVNSQSFIGLYEYGSLRCYSYTGGRLTYVGSGNAYDACRFSHPTSVVVGAKEGLPDHYLICLLQV